ncbi:MAG: hypothetical protein HY876_07500 [Coriobacteriales bacterium]|nr:hypothetical protein [Coriobacteriales bacterium]
MSMPAVRREERRVAHAPRLRLVFPGERIPRASARRTVSTSRAPRTVGRNLFAVFALCMAAVSAVGVGRVAMSAAAAQVSLESAELRKEIKSARYEGDMLEVQMSALAAPSRVRKLANNDLSLSEPKSVSYLGLDGSKEPRARKATSAKKKRGAKKAAASSKNKRAAPKRTSDAGSGVDAFMAEFMDIAAGEAQILMVGDVGLAASR